MKFVLGEKTISHPIAHQDDSDTIWGGSWHARRNDSGYTLDYLIGDHAGRERRIAISAEEFERLRADKAEIEAIIRAHERDAKIDDAI